MASESALAFALAADPSIDRYVGPILRPNGFLASGRRQASSGICGSC
jgi:hypothetical protein